MNQEPTKQNVGIANRLNMAGWRKHYVAAITADEEAWPRRESGGNLGRVFIILLLLHVFLIGAVVLYNIISPKAPPAVVVAKNNVPSSAATTLKTGASAATATPRALAINPTPLKPPAPAPADAPSVPVTDVKPVETAFYEVRSGDNVPGIAAHLGVRPDELIKLNNLDNTELYPGRKLTYPKRPLAPPPALKAIPVPALTMNPKLPKVETFKTPLNDGISTAPVKLKDSAITSADTPPKTPAMKSKVDAADQPPALKTQVKDDTSGTAKPKTGTTTENKTAKTSSKNEKSTKATAKPEKTSRDVAGKRSHVVGPKETLYSIARKYGVKVDALQKVNNIKDPTTLRDGMKLVIPSKS